MRLNKFIQRSALACTGLSALGMTSSCASAAPPANKPNVLVILVDDMGFSDIGCYGGEISTPNLDKLAAGGVRFTQFYNTARCSPSRASLMTGLYPHQAGMGFLDDMVKPESLGTHGKLSDRAVTMAEALKPSGYYTAMTGKWHMGQKQGTTPWNRGFDHSLNSPRGALYFPNQKNATTADIFLDGQPKPLASPEFGNDWYSSDLWTTYSLKFIDQAITEKKPFFVYEAFCAPHFPLMAPEKDIAKYRGKYMAGWDKLREARYQRQIKMGLIDPKWPLAQRPLDTPAWDTVSEPDKKRFDEQMAIYAAMVDNMDQNVGRLVEGLKKRGVLDNTLILFMSDNGGNAETGPRGVTNGEHLGDPNSNVFLGMNWATLNNTPLRRFKHFTHEGGISTPLIAHWPAGIPKARDGKWEKQPGHLVDVMATVMDATGTKYPTTYNGNQILPMEGTSLLPAFQGKDINRTKPIFWEHEGNRAIRQGKWKLVSKLKEPWELYDIEADRTEQRDLAKEHPDLVKDMTAQWETWAAKSFVDPWQGRHRNDWGEEEREPEGDVGSEAMTFDLKPGTELERANAPLVTNRSITITAKLGAKHGDGVIVAQGGAQAGYALYVREGKLELATKINGELTFVTSPENLPAGPLTIEASLIRGGTYELNVNGRTVATKKATALLKTMPLDGLQVGKDAAGLVGRYDTENSFQGEIESVRIELKA